MSEEKIKTDLDFYKKLIKAKKEMGAVKKTTSNPFFKSKYADLPSILEVVEPPLLENGLIILQPIKDGKVFTIITDGSTSIESSIELGMFNKPQDMGSAITYYRRYTLQSLLGISAEDDDGNIAQKAALPKISEERFSKAMIAIAEGKAKITDLMKFDLTDEQKEVINDFKNKQQ